MIYDMFLPGKKRNIKTRREKQMMKKKLILLVCILNSKLERPLKYVLCNLMSFPSSHGFYCMEVITIAISTLQ